MYIKVNPSSLLPLGLLATSGLSSPVTGGQQQHLLGDSQALAAAIHLHSSKPLVTEELLAGKIEAKNLLSRSHDLYTIAKISEPHYNHPTRVIGSLGHVGTIKYVQQVLGTLGGYYKIHEQVFPAVSGNVYESRLTIGKHPILSARAMSLTPPTKNKEPVFAQIVAVANDGCNIEDFTEDVNGAIALIKRGNCSFGQKSENAGTAGAVAALVYNNEAGELSGTLGTPKKHHVATFGISDKVGLKVLEKLSEGKEVDASAYIDATVDVIETRNVVAQTVLGDPDNCVMLGGHSDSVEEGPGVNDDGSGSMTLLEVAVQLSKFSVNNCVRFAWWSGEEEGLLGSTWYAEHLSSEENVKIRLFMDYDMMASPNFAYQIYNATDSEGDPKGSEQLRNFYINGYKELGVNYTFIPFDGRSDYVGFIDAGIPAGGVATGAEGVKTAEEVEMFGGWEGKWYDPCYHQLCDDLTNLNSTAYEVNGKLVAKSVAKYANSFESFPPRKLESAEVRAERMAESKKRWKYRGKKLVM
ncbi:hypothetical protein H072_4639 [Dactylellina haptotyla CBS 200.50]|uniref:Peptide hydrolase n=1 Tax=Dactylellina haptotyla (strain CBS 200.50) TaxID=1284197 RepID=S8C1L1_DACHA|nr:hypothetical protein H072_4639 [Dactylellina haptotyla CBS 200.50]